MMKVYTLVVWPNKAKHMKRLLKTLLLLCFVNPGRKRNYLRYTAKRNGNIRPIYIYRSGRYGTRYDGSG